MDDLILFILDHQDYFKNFSLKEANVFPPETITEMKPEYIKIIQKIKPKNLKDYKNKQQKKILKEVKNALKKLKEFIPKKKKKKREKKILGETIAKDIETVEKNIEIIGEAQKKEKDAIKEIKKGKGIRKRKKTLSGYQLFIKEDMAKDRKTGKASLTLSAKKWKTVSEAEKLNYKNRAKNMKPKEESLNSKDVKKELKKEVKKEESKKELKKEVKKEELKKELKKEVKKDVKKKESKKEVKTVKKVKKKKKVKEELNYKIEFYKDIQEDIMKKAISVADYLEEEEDIKLIKKILKLSYKIEKIELDYKNNNNIKKINKIKKILEEILENLKGTEMYLDNISYIIDLKKSLIKLDY